MSRRAWTLLLLPALALGAVEARAVRGDLARPRNLHGETYAPSGECQRCHPSHYASWARTFHRTMTQRADPSAVAGDFDDATFRYGGITAHMDRSADGAFEMTFRGREGALSRARVERTVGSRRIQQYLAREGDVYLRLPMAWNIDEGRWMHMNGAFLTPDPPPPAEGGHVSREDYYRHVTRWNDNCVFCHNVAPDPGWDERTQRWETEVAELGVACGACHGPGEEHIRRNRNPLRRYALHLSDAPDPTIVDPARLSPERSAAICGRCHGQRITGDVGRFLRVGDPFVPGDRLADYSRPLARDTPLRGDPEAFAARFWPDGTARLTAYEYQGLLRSPCARGGMTCTSCHGMHEGDPRGQLRPETTGDGACTGCHGELAAPAAAERHAGHRSVACADCHMPRIVYGLVRVHRSHRVESPVPSLDETRPDACTLCHADRSLAWAVDGAARLFGEAQNVPASAGPPERGSLPAAPATTPSNGSDAAVSLLDDETPAAASPRATGPGAPPLDDETLAAGPRTARSSEAPPLDDETLADAPRSELSHTQAMALGGIRLSGPSRARRWDARTRARASPRGRAGWVSCSTSCSRTLTRQCAVSPGGAHGR